ncbi:hypothetical protein RRG08_032968 [Elysia crispata]|uniref:Uncharacterized protein n=1 Tax=Elysia crispata TaxID=231223 RepID=A0AAE1D436_9GAST|nr:hypothetical protein RRG08_032968 [Elysia crispata]
MSLSAHGAGPDPITSSATKRIHEMSPCAGFINERVVDSLVGEKKILQNVFLEKITASEAAGRPVPVLDGQSLNRNPRERQTCQRATWLWLSRGAGAGSADLRDQPCPPEHEIGLRIVLFGVVNRQALQRSTPRQEQVLTRKRICRLDLVKGDQERKALRETVRPGRQNTPCGSVASSTCLRNSSGPQGRNAASQD